MLYQLMAAWAWLFLLGWEILGRGRQGFALRMGVWALEPVLPERKRRRAQSVSRWGCGPHSVELPRLSYH